MQLRMWPKWQKLEVNPKRHSKEINGAMCVCPASGIWNGGGTGLLNAPYKFGSPLTNRGRRRPAPIPPPTFQAPLLPRRGTRAPVLARLPARVHLSIPW